MWPLPPSPHPFLPPFATTQPRPLLLLPTPHPPALMQVFLGVYYSVTSIAKAKVFTEGRLAIQTPSPSVLPPPLTFQRPVLDPSPQGFLWIPNLSGPIADRREGISWLTEGWLNGTPDPRLTRTQFRKSRVMVVPRVLAPLPPVRPTRPPLEGAPQVPSCPNCPLSLS